MHRIHFMRKDDRTGENQFYFIGDGQKNIEGPIKETRIFGCNYRGFAEREIFG